MADQRSVLKEYRHLDEKLRTVGLSAVERARWEELRDLVEPGAPPQPGFDVNAAAADLRASLAEPEPAPSDSGAAPLDPASFETALSADLGDGGYDPNAQPYDPNAQPYDPNAQPYDPNAQPYDPNAQPYDPNAQPYDLNAQPYDPNAQPYDPNAQAYDPNAQAYDPNAQAYDPSAQAYDADAGGGEVPGGEPLDLGTLPPAETAAEPAAMPDLELGVVDLAQAPGLEAGAADAAALGIGAIEPETVQAIPFAAEDLSAPPAEPGAGTPGDRAAGEESWESSPPVNVADAPPVPLAPAADFLDEAAAAPAPAGDAAGLEPEPVDLEDLIIDEAPPESEGTVEAAPAPPPDAGPSPSFVPGEHRVVVHTVEGQVKRGFISDAELDSAEVELAGLPGGGREVIPASKVKAIFFMLGAGEALPPPAGKKVRVTFQDGRLVGGFSPDYDPGRRGFFVLPADTRTSTARIWVYRGAVREVLVS